MKSLFLRLWRDDGGALIASEWIFVATILVIGIITGLVVVRNSVNAELEEFAAALGTLSQGYSFGGQSATGVNTANTDGSQFIDPPNSFNVITNTAAISTTTSGTGTPALGDPTT